MNARRLAVTVLFFFAVLIPAAFADLVTLTDGTVREGEIVAEDAASVTLEMRIGALRGRLHLPRNEILKIEKRPLPPDPVETEAAALKASAKKKQGAEAAEAWAAVGEHYSRHSGYSAPAKEAFLQALRADPENAAAHKALGHIRTAEGWKDAAAENRAKGLVPLSEKVWLKPEERAKVIDQAAGAQLELYSGVSIGRRTEEKKQSAEELRRLLELKLAEEEQDRKAIANLERGEELLRRLASERTANYVVRPVYAVDGVGFASGSSSMFVGRVEPMAIEYTGYPWGRYWAPIRPQNAMPAPVLISPGVAGGNFSGYTVLNPWNSGYYPAWGGGWGLQLRGGGNPRWTVNLGGFYGSTTTTGTTGIIVP
jgi:hypothetical protein